MYRSSALLAALALGLAAAPAHAQFGALSQDARCPAQPSAPRAHLVQLRFGIH